MLILKLREWFIQMLYSNGNTVTHLGNFVIEYISKETKSL